MNTQPKITLRKWAESRYNPVPHDKTLQRWARDVLIIPPPEKVGRTYYVEPNAEYRDHKRVS
jgi:hypothetical protein